MVIRCIPCLLPQENCNSVCSPLIHHKLFAYFDRAPQ